MRKIIKMIATVVVAALAVIQFIRPTKNDSGSESPNDFFTKFHPPADVQEMLKTSCFDCHSSGTRYPWYAGVQPVGWWLQDHIDEGKREVNFTEFGGYRLRRQYRKLNEMVTQLEQEEMPLPSYLFIHREAKLSPEQKGRLLSWIKAATDSMKAIYPLDSLERR